MYLLSNKKLVHMNTDNNIHVFAQFIFDFEFAFKINRRECL